MLRRMILTISASLAAAGCGSFGNTLGEGMCVAADAGCLKSCQDQYRSYREGLPRGEANQIYRSCVDACQPGGC
ncbi:MAG: hypothetical protein GC152_08235 [Alphaproteobacteria bacterium]|nr:hypothetical protein [Alphaproteobacteria bacterium]